MGPSTPLPNLTPFPAPPRSRKLAAVVAASGKGKCFEKALWHIQPDMASLLKVEIWANLFSVSGVYVGTTPALPCDSRGVAAVIQLGGPSPPIPEQLAAVAQGAQATTANS